MTREGQKSSRSQDRLRSWRYRPHCTAWGQLGAEEPAETQHRGYRGTVFTSNLTLVKPCFSFTALCRYCVCFFNKSKLCRNLASLHQEVVTFRQAQFYHIFNTVFVLFFFFKSKLCRNLGWSKSVSGSCYIQVRLVLLHHTENYVLFCL